MKAPTRAWRAWGLLAATLTLVGLTGIGKARAQDGGDGWDWLFVIPFLAYAVVGAVVAARRPEHRIGWLFSAVGLAAGLAGLELYAHQPPLAGPGWEPLRTALLLLASVAWIATLSLALIFSLLFFPTGHLPSPRWRPVVWLTLLTSLGAVAGELLNQPPAGAPGAEELPAAAPALATLLFVLIVFGAAASLIVRFRRARDQERQQLKWFAAATALVAVMAMLVILGEEVPALSQSPVWPLVQILWPLTIATIPIAAGIAVLRYRLYDIDVLINRALVYGAVSAAELLVYLAAVVLLQGLFRAVTGQESNLAIVVSTLLAAALFHPLRRRLQGFIDRRFYRRKYDAATILAAFGAHLRDEVDVTTLAGELVRVADETMQPAHVSLWLPPRAPGEFRVPGSEFREGRRGDAGVARCLGIPSPPPSPRGRGRRGPSSEFRVPSSERW